jgi:hypothetical protein
VAIARAFAAAAPFPVEVLDGPGAGLADNFWHAAGHARGHDLIAWADQDDVWSPDKLRRCERALVGSGADFASHSAVVVDRGLRPLGRRRYPDYRRDRAWDALEGDPWPVPSGFASLFRSELLDAVRWDERPRSHQTGRPMNHDHVVSLRAFASGRRVEVSEPLARYRQHGGNAAGDPSTHGVGSLRTALAVGGDAYARLAEIARGYGAFLATLPEDGRAESYFEEVARRCERRADVYRARGARGRLRSLARAAREGVYAPRERGGFSALALAKDAVDISRGTAARAARGWTTPRGGSPRPPA